MFIDWLGLATAALASTALFCSVSGCSGQPSAANRDPFVMTYPTPEGSASSRYYSVSVNGVPVFVHNQREVSYAHFGMAGPVEVRVTVSEAVRSYDLSPHSAQVDARVEEDSIVFRLDTPRQLLLHKVNESEEVLCLLADPPEDDVPDPEDANVTDIRSWVPDDGGRGDASAAIQRALAETPEGGTLCFPAGRYTFTDIAIPANRSVYLAPGAVLQASEEREGQIDFSDARNGKLFGRGTIDGKGYIHRHRARGREKGRTLLSTRQGCSSQDFAIEGIVVRNAPIWTAILFDTLRWRIANVKIVNDCQYVNRDGIDPHSSRLMTIDGCFMYVSDDPIAYSTTRPDLQLGSVIKNCVFYNGGTGTFARIGPWVGDGTRDILFENIDGIHGATDYAFGLYLGGSASDLRFRNIRIEDPGDGLVGVYTRWNDHYAGERSGSLRGALFEGIVSDSWGKRGIYFQAPNPDNSVREVTFRGLVVGGEEVVGPAHPKIELGSHVGDLSFERGRPTEIQVTASKPIAEVSSSGELCFTRSGDVSGPLSVRCRFRGTGKAGRDFEDLPETVTIPAGAEELRLPVVVTRAPSALRTLLVDLEHDEGYVVGPRYQAQVTLR